MMNTIEKNICQAIDIIVNRAISTAGYDKTIQATVVECVDETIGKYKIKYQDSVFYAYSNNLEVTYSDGANVYILVPGNDMSKDKTILGTTKKLGINYISTTEEEDSYDVNGKNCISSSENFGLCSYRAGRYVKTLYHKDYQESENLITLDQVAINEYIKNSQYIICGATIRTALDIKQQLRGNYGILFALDFADNSNNEIVTRYYVIDVDKMRGNPYKLLYDTRQYGVFEIDNANFLQVNSVSLFTYDFPYSKEESELIDDIFISNIELCGAERLSNDDVNSYSLSFITPRGTYFDSSSIESDTILLQAQVKIKGKVIDNDSQPLSFYWFIEHAGVTSQSQYYNKYGGQGWKCLNNYNIIEKATETEPAIVEWVPAAADWIVKKSDVIAKEIKYKCVVIYEDVTISKTIIIKNLTSAYDITIVSDEGQQFYFDTGFPTLTCLVGGNEVDSYIYSWGVTDNTGFFQTLSETPDLNNDYSNLKAEYDKLVKDIENEEQPEALVKNQLLELESKLNKYESITRVEKNKIHNLNVNTITNFSIYQCTVYSGDMYLGTASIVLNNKLETEGTYSLVINDGSYSYKYNENGVSPASSSLDSPIQIKALTFSVYNNLGQKIEDDVIGRADVRWIVPASNTMLEISDEYVPSEIDEVNGNKVYSGLTVFSYSIANRYDITKTRNNIELQVNYKDISLAARTDLTFIKEGESGTNGTEFVCRIVPNAAAAGPTPAIPVLSQINDQPYFLNYTPAKSGEFFKVQLWHNEDKVLDSVTSGTSTEGKEASVTWSVLRNKYTPTVKDASSLEVNANTGVFTYSGYNKETPAHIVKVTVVYDRVTYYATIPVITTLISDSNYRVTLKENTGFLYAVYSADGRTPSYSNSIPFELTVTQLVGSDVWEDVSQKTSDEYKVAYEWLYLGKVYEDSKWVDSINLGDRLGVATTAANQKSVKPLDVFDGQCVTNAIECIVNKDDAEVARIHIPIHLLLNKYGQAALNDWDGNSIAIDENGGFILSPQVGAGVKEKDNSFTGVLMGKVKEANKATEEVGLFGYSSGVRSIFLDAETGKAQFGATGKGQIIIDPTSNKAQLYSGNYVVNKSGLMIDLTTPEIRYGSGAFVVNQDGHLTAKGGGSIAGWNIDDDSLFTNTKILSSNVRLSSVNFSRSINDTERDNLRIALGTKFGVAEDGTMYASDAIVKGEIQATKGYIGTENNGWIIESNNIRNGKTSDTDEENKGIYLGTGRIAFGKGSAAYSYFNSDGIFHLAGDKIEFNGNTLSLNNISLDWSNTKVKSDGTTLENQFKLTEKSVESTIAESQSKYDTSNYIIHKYGYGAPDNTDYPPAEYDGRYYLDQSSGELYKSQNGAWVVETTLPLITTQLSSKIEQTAEGITSEVEARYETKVDSASKLTEAKEHADNAADTAEANANKYTDGQLEDYSTTVEMRSEIEQTATNIASTVEAKYETKSASSEKLNEAKGYADGVAKDAQDAANEYTDEQLVNYSTTVEMESRIEQTAESITSTVKKDVSETYETKEASASKLTEAKGYADDAATIAEENANAATDEKLTKYSTTTEMESKIDQAADHITSTVTEKVSETYETKEDAQSKLDAANAFTDEKLKRYSTTTEMRSEIKQTADSITSTVAKSQDKYDLGDYSINEYGYGEPNVTDYPPALYNGQYYLDQTTGNVYQSNGSVWIKVTEEPLPLITSQLSSQIKQTAEDITLEVKDTYETKDDATSKFDTAKSYTDTAENNANKHADDAASEAESNANSYTDSQIKISKEGIVLEVSQTYETKDDAQSKLEDAQGYADTAASGAEIRANSYTDSQIKVSADSITSTVTKNVTENVSQTYETKEAAQEKLETAKGYADTAEANAKQDTANKLKEYSTTTEMNSVIEQTAGSITSTVTEKVTENVEKTYETKEDAQAKLNTAKGYADSAQSAAEATAKNYADTAEANANKATDGKLVDYPTTDYIQKNYSTITQTADSITAAVEGGNLISQINLTKEQITIDADKINLKGAVTADAINVDTLSTISANMGILTAGIIQSPDFQMSDYSMDSSGSVVGTVLSGCQMNLTAKAFYTPQITIKDNYINLDGYLTVGSRDTTKTIGAFSIANGYKVSATGGCAHAEGNYTTASQSHAHSEGYYTTASGYAAHAEGYYATASGAYAHAEGTSAQATGERSHAEGISTEAIGYGSHAEGESTEASGRGSHAEGFNTVASGDYEHVFGKYNVTDKGELYALVVGGGTSDQFRENIMSLSWEGNLNLKGYVSAISFSENGTSIADKYQPTITGAATTVVSSDLPVSRVLISNASGKITYSGVTSTELLYLSGTTSKIQTQIDNLNTSIGNVQTQVNKSYQKLNSGVSGYTYNYNCVSISSVNLNNINESGLYFCTNCSGRPVSENGFMIAITYSGTSRGLQLYFPVSTGMWKRINSSGTWGDWKQISNV